MQFCCFNSGGQNYKMEAFPEWALFGGSKDNLSLASPLSLPWQLAVAIHSCCICYFVVVDADVTKHLRKIISLRKGWGLERCLSG